MIKLVKKKKKNNTVTPAQMKDGDIGVIVGWIGGNEEYIGRVVQRHGDSLITIGGSFGEKWGLPPALTNPNNQVKLLKPGKEYTIKI